MNRERAWELAGKALGLDDLHQTPQRVAVTDAIMEAVAMEREACAKVVDARYDERYLGVRNTPALKELALTAMAIRARSAQ